jgi:hypothetical protein
MILQGASLEAIMKKIDRERDNFLPVRKRYLIY